MALPRITQKEMTEREQRELKTLLDRARIAHGRPLSNAETNSVKKEYIDKLMAQREAEAEERSLTEEERAAIIPQKVLYFPTKDEWRFPSKMEYIEAGLDKFAKSYESKKILSACFPMLGCGCGKLKWDEVYPLMDKYLNPILCQCVVVHADANGKPFTFSDEIGGAAS